MSVLAIRVRVTKGSSWRPLPSHAYDAGCDSLSRSSRGCSRTLRGLSWSPPLDFLSLRRSGATNVRVIVMVMGVVIGGFDNGTIARLGWNRG